MSKKQKATDPSRFEGNGISYRAKLIGIEDVAEARGDKMCQETIQKLKGNVKASGQHKQKIFVNVTLEGLKIIDGTTLSVLHTHPVHQISFISRDVQDSRAFGYVFGSGDGSHKFFGIKTASSAEAVVLALRDLFQTVYEMKKQEMEEVKARANSMTENQSEEKSDAKVVADATSTKTEENVEQVPINNAAPVPPQEQEEVVANLLDLEDQVDTILKGIEQIQNLDFEDLTSEETPAQPSSTTTTTPATAAPASVALNDPWGVPAAEATPAPPKTSSSSSSSALADLEQLSSPPPPSSNPFGGMSVFPPAPASTSAAFFGLGQPGMVQSGTGFGQQGFGQPGMAQPGMTHPGMTQPGMAQPGMAQPGMGQGGMPFGQQGTMGQSVGLPVTSDPFGDPFNTTQAQQHMQAPHMMASAAGQFGMPAPFGSPFPTTVPAPAPAPAQPFPGSFATPAPPGGMQPGFGRESASFGAFGTSAAPVTALGVQVGPQGGAVVDPFQPSGGSLLQPAMSGDAEKARPVSPAHAKFFDDLVDMKKAGGAESAAKTPKELFPQPQKKSLNEMKGGGGGVGAGAAPQTSQANSSPFGDSFFSSPINGKPQS